MTALTNREFYRTDRDLESTTGIRIEIGNWTFWSKRAGGSNTAFQARMTVLRKPHERLLNSKVGANDEALAQQQQDIFQKLLIQAAAEKLLLPKWDGVVMADIYETVPEGIDPNAEAPFSVENAVALFTLQPDSFNDFYKEAAEMGNFRKKVVEDQSGNSVTA
ncbi:hypothetical protein [Azospirillum aestuarii]|uniref:hypothetical protein n=1 Tax=Azospirillum aestuarii TaxID=2802052 RepID=UPI0040551828